MSIEVWPFLVSRNRYLDYRTVVAPDFICEAKTGNLLARVTTGDLTEPGKGFIRQIFGSKVGDFTIVYRILKATQKDLNSQVGDEILKDQFGREILLIEGVVIQEIKSKEAVFISQKNIEEIHQKLIEGYTEFWEHRDPNPAIPSDKLSLSMDGSSRPLELEEIELFQVESPISNHNQEKKSVGFIKSWGNNVNYVVFLTIILAVMVAFGWIYRSEIWGTKIVYDCTTIEYKNIRLESKNNIDDVLNNLQKEYPDATILLDAKLELKSNEQWQYLIKREKLNELENYTINLYGNILKLQDHPLDLAIAQLSNQEIVEYINISAKIINRKECKRNS
ncbi:hypothetical protein [Dapis sp. BLCC M229]|uniref:hypothetical protein n=1 Tax=Dapis sp. BLCC M229 TaxID=3400188 RepID=UPI003CEF5958